MEVGLEGCLDMLILGVCCLSICILKYTHTEIFQTFISGNFVLIKRQIDKSKLTINQRKTAKYNAADKLTTTNSIGDDDWCFMATFGRLNGPSDFQW